MPSDPEVAPLPPHAPVVPPGANYRRLVTIVALVAGLILFIIFLPNGIRTALWNALLAQWALDGMIILFALIAVSLVWSAGQRLDTWVFQLFNLEGNHPVWLDRFMWLATQLGSMIAAAAVAGLFLLLRNNNLAIVITLGTLSLWLLVESIKALTNRARPFLDVKGTHVLGKREPGRSFPSGHTAQTFFLATLISQQLGQGAGFTLALYGVAVLVGFTRVYVGVHYPRDVLGGAALGSAWGIVATLINGYWLNLRF